MENFLADLLPSMDRSDVRAGAINRKKLDQSEIEARGIIELRSNAPFPVRISCTAWVSRSEPSFYAIIDGGSRVVVSAGSEYDRARKSVRRRRISVSNAVCI